MNLFPLPSAGSAQTAVFPKALAGKYTGLLTHPAVILGETLDGAFGRVDITVSSSGSVSGKLILIDKKSYSFTTKLVTVDGLSAAKEGAALAKTYAKYIPTKLGINSIGSLRVAEGMVGSHPQRYFYRCHVSADSRAAGSQCFFRRRLHLHPAASAFDCGHLW